MRVLETFCFLSLPRKLLPNLVAYNHVCLLTNLHLAALAGLYLVPAGMTCLLLTHMLGPRVASLHGLGLHT